MSCLYLSDLDGTLLDSEARLTENTVAILQGLMAKGLCFSIATARTQGTVLKMMEPLPIRAPMILMNGVMIYDPLKQENVCVRYLPEEAAHTLVSLLKQHKLTGFFYVMEDGDVNTYYENLDAPHRKQFHDERVSKYGKRFTHTKAFSLLPHDHVVYCSLCEPYDRLIHLRQALEGVPGIRWEFYRDVYWEGMWYLEIFSQNASKEEGVRFLRTYYGYERIVSFGDNLNDLPMFAQSDYTLAVANAKEDVKRRANEVIGSNQQDGVARWLQAHFEKEGKCP